MASQQFAKLRGRKAACGFESHLLRISSTSLIVRAAYNASASTKNAPSVTREHNVSINFGARS